MDFTRRLALGSGGAALSGLAAPRRVWAQATPATAGMIEIPIAVKRNQAFVQVSFNGRPTVPLLIDTGASGISVFPSVAQAQGLKPVDVIMSGGVSGTSMAAVYQADTLLIGGRLRMTKPTIATLEGLPPEILRGIVTPAFFGITEMDFDRQVMRVFNSAQPSLAGYNMQTFQRGLSQGQLQPHPVLNAEIDGIKCRLIVDTGANGTLTLFASFVHANKLWDRYPKYVESASRGVTGVSPLRIVRAGSLKVAGYTFEQPNLHLIDPERRYDDSVRDTHGLLGMEILRRFSLLYDPKGKRIGFKPGQHMNDVYRYDRAGVTLVSEGQVHRAGRVLAGGPAFKAGLRPRDRIVAWKGEGGVTGLEWALQGAAGDVISILIERGGVEQEVHITLEDRL